MEIQKGDAVLAVDAFGQEFATCAVSGVEVKGHAFPVVWIARPLQDGGTDEVPWPLESVRRA